MVLPIGKVPPKVLRDVIFDYLGEKRCEVIVGPSFGLDGAVINIGDKSLITSMDPITGALERIGWLAVNVNANDVATFGAQPAFLSSCLLLPENIRKDCVETICKQIDSAARKLGIAITGGHSEVTPNLPSPIVVGCCFGVVDEGCYVTAQEAKPGNRLILTKTVGIEGTAILATDRYSQLESSIAKPVLKKAGKLLNQISIVEEAMLAFQTGHVTAMHDPTEGGVVGGIHELAAASNLGFKIYEEKIPVAKETLEICEFFQIDPLQLIASGSLLIAVENGLADYLIEILGKKRIVASDIGELLQSPEKQLIIREDGSAERLARPQADHLWLALQKDGR